MEAFSRANRRGIPRQCSRSSHCVIQTERFSASPRPAHGNSNGSCAKGSGCPPHTCGKDCEMLKQNINYQLPNHQPPRERSRISGSQRKSTGPKKMTDDHQPPATTHSSRRSQTKADHASGVTPTTKSNLAVNSPIRDCFSGTKSTVTAERDFSFPNSRQIPSRSLPG